MPRAATATETSTDLVDAAQHALDLVGEDSSAALEAADAVVAALPRPRSADEVLAVVTAQRAAARALRNHGDVVAALSRARRAIALAERRGLPRIAAEARMTQSFLLLESGRTREALATIDQALSWLDGLPAAQARTNRALILQRTDRPREALAEYAEALTVIRRHGDGYSECLARSNRAQLHAALGDTGAAVADQEWAYEFDRAQGRRIDAADDLWNLGSIAFLAGDIPRTLSLYDSAEVAFGAVPRPHWLVGRAEVLLEAGLVSEALTMARQGTELAAEQGWGYLEADGRLWQALASLALPDPDLGDARDQARLAVDQLQRQGRPDWALVARHAELVIRLRGSPRGADLDAAVDLASLLRDRGHDAHAADLRLVAGQAAASLGDGARTRTLLGPLGAQTGHSRLEIRSRAWFARALLQTEAEGTRAAHASMSRAWRASEQQAALRGATELRAAAAGHAASIVDSGTRLALDLDDARLVLEWAERGRAASMRRPAVRVPEDPVLAAALARLRWSAAVDDAAVQGGAVDRTARARRRHDEGVVLRLTRHARASGTPTPPVGARDVRARLEGAVFVEYVASGTDLYAVRVDSSRTTLLRLAPLQQVERMVESLRFALRRLVTRTVRSSSDAALRRALRQTVQEMVGTLHEPLSLGRRPWIVSPTGALNALPWCALALSGDVPAPMVAPSAGAWASACTREVPAERRVVAVAGPGLPGAAGEAEQVSAGYAGSLLLTGADAAAGPVLDALATADLGHVAAHGRLRRDNPLFSALLLHDGPLSAYDLESASAVPAEVVLSCCSSGEGQPIVGDEILGLAWTFLGAGSRTVVAPLLPLPDEATAPLMQMLHAQVRAQGSLPRAWARVQRDVSDHDELALVAACFSAYGA